MTDSPSTWSAFLAGWELFREPTLAATLAGGLLGLLGVYVVLRRMVFLAAALSQSAGLGVAAAWFAQVQWGVAATWASPTVGATLASLAAAGAMMAGRTTLATRRDGVLGWVYLVGAAGTLALGTRIVQEVQDIETILFGSAVAVLPEDLARIAEVALGLGLLHLWLHRGFIQVAIDADGARVRGLPARLLEALLILSLALAVSVCTRILGALPVFAFTVLPAMAALAVAPNVAWALVLAAVLGSASGFAGYVLAFAWQLPVGASQTLVAALAVALVFAGRWSWRRLLPGRAHAHSHGPGCGHLAVVHGDHVDYLHAGHRHHQHPDHVTDHGPPPKT